MATDVHVHFNQRKFPGGYLNQIDLDCPRLHSRPAGMLKVEFLHAGANHLPTPAVLDGYLFGVLLYAMGGAKRLRIHGAISTKALRNAHLLAEAWHGWLPEQYRPVEIIADQVLSDSELAQMSLRATNHAIAAFSGGVDSTFTALRHAGKLLGQSSFNVTDVVMVHGFDVSLDNQHDFDELISRTAPLIQQLGVELHIVRTNIKDLIAHNWEHVFGAHLACILHQFSGEFSEGLIASGAVMSAPDICWGSTPQLDYLLSGSALEIVHDGAGCSRTDKVALIAQNPIARHAVKVCWQGERQGRNCGHCEKCVRTRLNFMAAGTPEPECFEGPLDLPMIDQLQVSNAAQLNLLKELLNDAAKYNTQGAWSRRLNQRINHLNNCRALPHVAVAPNSSNKLLQRLQTQQVAIANFLRKAEPISLLTDMPGNIGDHLIWAGTDRMLNLANISFRHISRQQILESGQKHWPGTLVIPGSGACTTKWHEWLPELIISASKSFGRVVILPSEFEPAEPIVREALLLPNVYPFAREVVSYNKIKTFGWASLSHDLALWARDFLSVEQPDATLDKSIETSAGTTVKRDTTLLALRTDKSSLLPDYGLLPASYNNDIGSSCASLDEFLNIIARSQTIITDRLHVTVAAVMLGKQVQFIDPFAQKITRYIRYNFQNEFAKQLHQRDLNWLLEQGHAIKENPAT